MKGVRQLNVGDIVTVASWPRSSALPRIFPATICALELDSGLFGPITVTRNGKYEHHVPEEVFQNGPELIEYIRKQAGERIREFEALVQSGDARESSPLTDGLGLYLTPAKVREQIRILKQLAENPLANAV